MADTTLPVQAGELPSGFCPSSYQEMLNGYAAVLSVLIASGTGVSVVASSTKPADTTAVWLQLDSLGRPVRVYYFAGGAWLSMHPQVPGAIMLWDNALPNFTTFDGGDANPISPVSGPMWEEVTEMRARSPLGPGTLPSGLVVAVTDTGGEENHTLISTETPLHTHFQYTGEDVTIDDPVVTGAQVAHRRHVSDNFDYSMAKSLTAAVLGKTSGFGGDGAGATTSHNTMHPYVGMYALRRTAKLFYVVP